MGQIRLGIGQVNITNYLIAVARKTTTPLVIEAQEPFAPPHPTTRNVVVPAVGDIDPVIYYVDFYESANGTSFDLLLSQFVYDLKNKIIVSERRFYRVGSGNPDDPDPDQQILADAYLNGKTISGVFKEGYRYLRPDTEPVPEWIPHAGGGIELQGSLQFSQDETYTIEISYLADQTTGGGNSGSMYTGVETITADTSLSITHRNKRLRCHCAASNKLVVTMESVASVPDGTFYHFTSNGGTQNQTRILPAGSETITINGELYAEITIGKGEYLRIVKVGSIWEAEMAHPFILQVGERYPGGWKDHPNGKPEDGQLYDGDEWPRLWWWIQNKLPSTHKITDDNVINGGYTHPAEKPGLFVVHSSLKKFRMPNTQGLSEKGLSNFIFYGNDSNRSYDYPGGFQEQQVGEINFSLHKGNGYVGSGQNAGWFAPGDPSHAHPDEDITVNDNKVNTVPNFGVIYMRRI